MLLAQLLPRPQQAFLRELLLGQLRRPGAGIEPGVVLARRRSSSAAASAPNWTGELRARRSSSTKIRYITRSAHGRTWSSCAQLREPRIQPHQQLLHQVFGAIDGAGPAIRGAIQRGDVRAQQPLEFRGVAGCAAPDIRVRFSQPMRFIKTNTSTAVEWFRRNPSVRCSV